LAVSTGNAAAGSARRSGRLSRSSSCWRFAHAVVGVRSVLDDYVHTRARLVAADLLVRAAAFILGGPVCSPCSSCSSGAKETRMTPNYDIIDTNSTFVVLGAAARVAGNPWDGGGRLNTACVYEGVPTRSHTVAAQGGISAALAIWQGTIGAARVRHGQRVRLARRPGCNAYLCAEAVPSVIELEHFGVPFSRTEAGTIYQRRFGGHTTEYAKGDMAYRACAAADRTGAMPFCTRSISRPQAPGDASSSNICDHLLIEDGVAAASSPGAWRMVRFHRFRASMTVSLPADAAGSTSLAHRPTPAPAMAAPGVARGPAVADMEFIQFHPTGVYGAGVLITRALGARRLSDQQRGRAVHAKYAHMRRTFPPATSSARRSGRDPKAAASARRRITSIFILSICPRMSSTIDCPDRSTTVASSPVSMAHKSRSR